MTKCRRYEAYEHVLRERRSGLSHRHRFLYHFSIAMKYEISKRNNALRMNTKPFSVSLVTQNVRLENDRHRNLYIMEVSHKETLHELHDKLLEMAIPYRSPFIREKKI